MTDFDLTALLPPPLPTRRTPATTQKPKTNPLAPLKAALAQSLMPDDNGQEMLKRQLATLDALFDHTITDYVDCTASPLSHSQLTRLSLALRMQGHCVATARALGAIEYMNNLSQAQTPDMPPRPRACTHGDTEGAQPPRQHDEQKEGL